MSYSSKYIKRQLSPLTEENLLKMNDSTYDAIERYYCSSGNEAPTHHQPRVQTQTRHQTSSPQHHQPRSRRSSRDVVMESPRLLPFPYHNDCHFLPTAEHKQHQHHQQKKKMATGSFSDLSLRSQRTSLTATSPSSATIPLSYSARRAFSTPPHRSRRSSALQRSSSATSTHQQETLLEPSLSSSSSSSSFSSASSFYKKGSSFLARLLDLMKKKSKSPSSSSPPPPPSPSSVDATMSRSTSSSVGATSSARLPKKNLVWFAEFSVNPPPPNGMVVTAA